jgi:hypothetical protein
MSFISRWVDIYCVLRACSVATKTAVFFKQPFAKIEWCSAANFQTTTNGRLAPNFKFSKNLNLTNGRLEIHTIPQ